TARPPPCPPGPPYRDGPRQALPGHANHAASRESDAGMTRLGRGHHFAGLGLAPDADRAPPSDMVEMGVEEASCGALAELVQHQEEVEIVVELAVRIERGAKPVHVDAVEP